MAGNSRRPGAVRKPGKKKPPRVGSGGQRRQGLAGRGPTPKASAREGHPARRRTRDQQTGRDQVPRDQGHRDQVPRDQGHRGHGPTSDIVVGRNAVVEALEVGIPAYTLLVQRSINFDRRIKAAVAAAARLSIAVSDVSKLDLDSRAGGLAHQGIGLVAQPFMYSDSAKVLRRVSEAANGRLAVLDGVTDPRNLGAIIRSAAAFGFAGVIIPERRAAAVTPVVWRASAGAVARVPVGMVTNVTRFIKSAQAAGCLAVGLDAGGEAEISNVPAADRPTILVVGGEGRGIGQLVARTCDVRARIAMARNVESLNAAVAAAIAMRELADLGS